MLVERCAFFGSHGVSIGGLLGAGNAVSDVAVRDCAFIGGTTAARIKSAQRAGGLVRNVTYANLTLSRVGMPVHIDQFYCADDKSECGRAFPTTIVFDGVSIVGVKGTQSGGFAGIVNCSFGAAPACRNLILSDIAVAADAGNITNKFVCERAAGKVHDVEPPGCVLETRTT